MERYIQTNDKSEEQGDFVNFSCFCKIVFLFIYGNKKSINDVCKSFFRIASCPGERGF